MNGISVITVVCTDRGQHPRCRIDSEQLQPADDEYIEAALTDDQVPEYVELIRDGWRRRGWRRPDGGYTFTFDCATCGRHVELREETWRRLVDGLQHAEVSVTDMSYWPC